jgi:putative transcriptional regulator
VTVPKHLPPTLLLASPSLQDPNFRATVVLLFRHDEEGAMGLVVNRPTEHPLGELLESLELVAADPSTARLSIGFGGPVSPGIGWIVYEGGEGEGESFQVLGDVRVSGSRSVLEQVVRRQVIGRFLFVLGYAGWAAGQLESELEAGAWVPAPVDRRLLFEEDPEKRWRAAYLAQGIDPGLWSASVGNA